MRHSLLIAEGDAELCDLYSEFLTNSNYDVAVAEDGLDCLRQLRRATPHVLVLDLELTWGGGDGVLDWLREDRAEFEFPVILMATVGREPTVAEVMTLPVVDFLSKPFALTTLAGSVHSAIVESQLHSKRWRHADSSAIHVR